MNAATIESARASLAIILGYEQGSLPEAIRQLDDLGPQTSGHLSHYLASRSYQKAWIHLQGESPEKGRCSP